MDTLGATTGPATATKQSVSLPIAGCYQERGLWANPRDPGDGAPARRLDLIMQTARFDLNFKNGTRGGMLRTYFSNDVVFFFFKRTFMPVPSDKEDPLGLLNQLLGRNLCPSGWAEA